MNTHLGAWRKSIRNGFVSGTVASIASTISLLVLGRIELDETAAPMNGPSQWIWGRYAPFENHFSFRYTVAGYAIHHAASVFWAILYERLRQHLVQGAHGKNKPVLAPAAAITTVAYVVDFNLTPRRLTPGFEKRLSKRGLFIVYGTFALGLAAGALIGIRAPRRRPNDLKNSRGRGEILRNT
jgi:hypothetical protein